jgi:pilus assembly protein CpaB
MFLRNVLLAVGAVFVLAGVGLMIVWFGSAKNPPVGVETPVESRDGSKVEVLTAINAIPSRSKVQRSDIGTKKVGAGDVQPGNRMPGQEAEFVDAISQRDIKKDDPLIASDFVKPSPLTAALTWGKRAMTIFC